MATKAKKIIYDISEIFYRNGKYGIERISIICKIIKSLLWIKKQQCINKFKKLEDIDSIMNEATYNAHVGLDLYLSKKDIHNLYYCFIELMDENNKDIADAIQQLVDNDKKTSGFIPTDNFSVRVMQSFAKKLYKGGAYIDPCVGSGRLLAGLDSEKIYGFDINENAISIAEAYLNLAENIDLKSRMSMKFSTENFLYKDITHSNEFLIPTFILDPPLNDPLEIADDNLLYSIKNFIYPGKGKVPSEYLFLAKILLSDRDKDLSYVSTFLNNFTFAQDKFRAEFRRYLIEDNLIAVVQSNFSDNNINKLILIGRTRRNPSFSPGQSPIYLITPKSDNIPDDILDQIVQSCIEGEAIDEKEFYSFAKINRTTVKELAENNYQIIMPQYYENETEPIEIKPLMEIKNELESSNINLIKNSKDLEKFLANLLKGIKNLSNIPEVEDKIKISNKGKKWYQIEKSEEANSIDVIMMNTHIAEKIQDIWQQVSFTTLISWLPNLLESLKIANKYARIKAEPDKLLVNISKNNSEAIKNSNNDFTKLMLKFNEKKLYCLSKKQIDLYEILVKYYLEYKYEKNAKDISKLTLNKFSESEIFTTLYTLKTLGVIQENSEYLRQNKEIIDIKDLDIISEIYSPFKGLIYLDTDMRKYI